MAILCGSDWLTAHPNLNAWVKVIRSLTDLDLNESGGYAIKSSFNDFNKPITLLSREFALIAAQQPLSGGKSPYVTVLVSGVVMYDEEGMPTVTKVADEDIEADFDVALRRGIISTAKSAMRFHGMYKAAVYCYMQLGGQPRPRQQLSSPNQSNAYKTTEQQRVGVKLPASAKRRHIDLPGQPKPVVLKSNKKPRTPPR